MVQQAWRYSVTHPDEGFHPLVINISLGITAGAKNGSGFLETYLRQEIGYYQLLTRSALFPEGAPMEVILSFGNDRRSKQIVIKSFDATVRKHSVFWRLQPDDRAASYLEIRPQSRELGIRVRPAGEKVFQGTFLLDPGFSKDITSNGKLVGRIYREPNELLADSKDRPVYILAVKPTGGFGRPGNTPKLAPSGTWEVEIEDRGPALTDPASFSESVSLQVQRGDTPIGYRRHGRQSYLYDETAFSYDGVTRNWEAPSPASDETRSSTQSSITAAQLPLGDGASIWSVGASIGDKNTAANVQTPAIYTSKGSEVAAPVLTTPTQPDFSADGDDSHLLGGVLAAGTLSGTTRRLSGTSVSAPQVSRWRIATLSTTPFPANYELKRSVVLTQRASLGDENIFFEHGRRSARIFRN